MKPRSHGKDRDDNMDKSRSKDGLKAAGKKRLEEFRQKRLQKPGTGKGSVSKSGTEKELVTKKTESEETCEEQGEIPGTFGSSTLESASNISDEDKGCRDYKSQDLFGTFGALLSGSKENKHDDAKHHEHIMEDAVLVDQQEDVSPKHDKEDAYAGELSTGMGDTAEEKISEFLGINAKLHEEFAAAKQLSDKLILEKEELGLQLVQCRHSKSGLEQKLAQLEVLVQAVSTDKIRLSDELLILKGNLQNAMNDNGRLVAEMETVGSQCLHLDRDLKASKQEMLNVQNSCEEKINTLEEQKLNLLQSLEIYSQQLFDEKRRHASEVEDLKSLLNNASEEKMELSSKLLEAIQQIDFQRNQLQSEIDALKSSDLELKQKLHDLNSEKEQALLEVTSHKQWISKAEINQQEIVIKLKEDKQIISVLNAENLELQGKLNGLESEVKIARQCLQETREEKETSKCQIEIFEAENQKLVAEIKELNHQMQQIMKTNSELAIQADECKNGLQDAYERDKMQLEAYALIESKLGLLNNEKLLLEQQIEDYKEQHTVASISGSELRKELEKSAENNRLAMLDLRALETQVKELEGDKIELIEEIKTSHCRSDMLEADREELMSRTRELLLDLATKEELILKLEEEKQQIIYGKEFLNHSLQQTCEEHVSLKMEYSSFKQVHEKVVHERDKFQLELQKLTLEWDKSAEERQNTLVGIENLKEGMHESIASGIGELQNLCRGIQEEKEFLNSRLQTLQTGPIVSGREEPNRSITGAIDEHGGIKNELWMQEQEQIIKEMETLESGLKVLTLQFDEVSMEKNCVVAENDRLKEDLALASNDIKSKVNEFIKLETALHSIEGENESLKVKLEELVQAAQKIEAEKLSLSVALEEAIHEKEKLLSELERSVAHCGKVMGEKDAIILEKENLSKDLLIFSNEHKILLNEIAELNNFRQKAMEDRRLLESKVQMSVEENEMAEKLARHKIGESSQQLQQKTEEHAQVLCELKDQKQIAEELMKEKQDTVLNLTTSVFEFEQLVKQRDAEIEKLRDDLRMVSEESKKFATDMADLKVLVGRLQQEKSILEVEKVNLEEELKALADKRAELERDFADIGDTNSKLMFDLELSKQNLEELTVKSATDTAALVSELEKLKKRLFDQNSQDVEKVNVFRAHIEALGNTTSCQVAPASGQQNSPSKVPEVSGHVLSGVAKLVKKFEAKANTGANISEIDKEESCVANAIKRITSETSKQGGIEHDSGIGLRADLEMLLEKLRSSDEEKMQLNLALRRLEAFAASQHQQLTLLAEENKHVAEQVTEENRILRDEIKCLQETITKRSLEFEYEKSALEEVLQNVINMAKDVVGDQHALEPVEDQKAQVMSFMSLIVQRLGEIRQIEEDLVIATQRVAELEHELSENFNVLQNICKELELSKEENHRLTEYIATSEMESNSVKQTNSELNHQLEVLEMKNACERNKFGTELSVIGEQLDEAANQFASMKLLLQHLEEDKHMQSEFLRCLKEDIFKLMTDLQLLREEYNAMPVKNESEGMENVVVIPSTVTSNYKNLPFVCNPETLLVELLNSIDATLRIDASISSPVNDLSSSLESFLPAVSIIYKEVIDHAASLREQLSSALSKLEQSNLDIEEHVRDYGTLKEEKEQELSELYRRVQVTSVRLLDYQSEVERLSLKSQQLSSEKEKLQLDLVETEQRLSTTREKLSLAVNKGKGLVQQRDALKQALAAQSEQSEVLKVELQKEREQFNLELQDMTERLQSLSDVNVLRDELEFAKDSAQQSVTAIERLKETILEYQILSDIDADAPSSLVDKVSFLLRDSHEAKQNLAEMKQQMEVTKQLVKSLLLEMKNEIGNLEIIEEEDGSASKLIDLLHECGDKVSELRNQNVLLKDELASLHRQVAEHSYLLEEKINLKRRTDAAMELLIQTLNENNFDHPLINDESMLLEDYLSTLVGKYKSAVSELAHIRTEPDTRDMTLRSLREELTSKDLELGDYNRKWEEAALTMAYQEDQIQGLLQRSQRQRDDMVVVSQERDSLHSQLSSLTADRDRLQLELTASEQRLTSVREKLSLAIKKGKGLAQQRDDLKQSLLEKSQEVENMNSHLLQYESSLQAALDHNKILEQEVYSLRDAMALTQKNLNESKEFKQRLELIVNELDGRSSDEPLKKIERLIRMLNQAQNKVSSFETEMSKLKSEVSVLHNQLSESNIRQGYLESSYKDAEAETASIIRKLEDTLSQREMQIESCKKEIEYLLSSHDEKQQQLTAFQDALFEANSREVSISNELASLMKKVSEISEEKQLLQASKVESWDYLEGAVDKLKSVALELHSASGSSESLESAISLEEVLVVISKALSNFVGYVGQNMATVDLAVKTKSLQKTDALEKLRRTAVDIFTLMASTDIHFSETRKDRSFKNMLENALNSKYGSDVSDSNHLGIKLHGHIENLGKLISWVEFESESFVEEICVIEGFLAKGLEQTTSIIEYMGNVHLEGVTPNVYEVLKAFKHDKDTLHSAIQYAVELVEQIMADNFQKVSPKLHAQYSETADVLKKSRSLANRSGSIDLAMHIDILTKSFTRFLQMQNQIIKDLEEDLGAKTSEISQLQNLINDLRTGSEIQGRRFRAFKENRDASLEEVESKYKRLLTDKQRVLESLQLHVAEAEDKIKTIEMKWSLDKSRVSELESQVSKWEMECQSKQQMLVDKDRELDQLQLISINNQREIEIQNQVVNEGKAQLPILYERIESLENTLRKKQAGLEMMEASRSKAAFRLSATLKLLNELQQHGEGLLTEIQRLQADLDIRDTEISAISQKLNSAEDEVKILQDALSAETFKSEQSLRQLNELLLKVRHQSKQKTMNETGSTMQTTFESVLEALGKHVYFLVMENSALQENAQKAQTALQSLQMDFEAVSIQKRLLQDEVTNRDSRIQRLQTDKIVEVEEMSQAALRASPSMSTASNVRSLRKLPIPDHVAVEVDIDDNIMNMEEKGHVIMPLGTLKFVPKAGRAVAEILDSLCISGGRLLMRQPMARLGFSLYWIAIHIWIFMMLVVAKY